MRVIAGSARGLYLDVPGTGVRPTMDQVKGAIFSSLAPLIPGASVLDLFAGSGGLGIEALSRGADSATLVEQDRKALLCIRKNLERTALTARVISSDVYRFLARETERYDLIFADPPYTHDEKRTDHARLLLENRELPLLLKQGGVFVLEKTPKTVLPDTPHWVVTRLKRYGNTELVFLESALNPDPTPCDVTPEK